MMSNNISKVVTIFVFCLGVIIGWWLTSHSFSDGVLLYDCERNVPRNQHCELIAVPPEDMNDE